MLFKLVQFGSLNILCVNKTRDGISRLDEDLFIFLATLDF